MLRAEKGYIIVGQETDGTVTPDDVGLDWAIGKIEDRTSSASARSRGPRCRHPTASSSSAC